MKIVITLLMTVNILCIQGFSQSLKIKIDSFMNEVRKTGSISFGESFVEKYNNLELLNLLQDYSEDNNSKVQYASQILSYQISRTNLNSVEIQQEVVKRLVNDFYENDPRLWQSSIWRLRSFEKQHFKPEVSNKIRRMLDETEKLEKNTVLIIGIADLKSEKDKLRQIIKESPINQEGRYWYNSPTWGAYLVLGRMGEKQYSRYCIDRIQKESNSQVLVYELFKDLEFLRTPESINLLRDYVFSDLSTPSDFDAIGLSYANNALANLARAVEYFPKEIHIIYPGENDVKQARAWLKKQKTLTIKR